MMTLVSDCVTGFQQFLGALGAVETEPRFGGQQALIDRFDVLEPILLKPAFESAVPAFGVYRYAIKPCGSSAKHAREVHARLRHPMQLFSESLVGHASAQVNEWLGGDLGHFVADPEHFHPRIRLLPREITRSFRVRHIHWDLDFEYIDSVAVLGELADAVTHNLWLLFRVFQSLLVSSAGVLPNKLQEKWHIQRPAFGAHTLHERVFFIVDRRIFKGAVIYKHLDGVGAHLQNSFRR